jgi:hypothetical protein
MKKHIPRGAPPLLFTALLFWIVLLITACDGCKVEIGSPNNPPTPPTNTYPTTPPTELPPATQTGAGTLGCKINGRVWTFWIPPIALTSEQYASVSESDGYGFTTIYARLWSADTLVDGYRPHHRLSFAFRTSNFEAQEFNNATAGTISENMFRFYLSAYKPNRLYYPDTSAVSTNNRVIVDFIDTNLNIISGRFNLTLFYGNNYEILDYSDSLVVTDGRFDFKYSQQ